jgi:CHAT domain-containing protein
VRDVVARATLETAEQARGRALSDYERLSETATANPERRAREQRRNELYRQIAARRFRLEGYLDRGLATDPHIAAIRADIGGLEREVDLLNAGLAKATSANTRAGAAPGVETLIRALPDDSAVIAFWLGAQRARAWIIARSGVQLIDLGDTARIDAAALDLYRALNDLTAVSTEERLKRLQALYRLIIAPLPEPIRNARALTFIPDGKLHYVPFAALAIGAPAKPEFLLDQHDIAIAPSLSVLQRAAPSVARTFPKEMLLVADPVYSQDDPRLAGSGRVETARARPVPRILPITLRGGTRTRLDGAAREAEAITQLIGPEHIVALNGFEATRDAFLAQDLAQYRYIHIAAHGSADARSPKFSGLVLSSVNRSGAAVSGQVFAGDLALRRMDADVVVLSACETALGPEAAGEGLLGLRYAAHAGGARSVVASLWQAPDVSAAQIMTEFYQRMTRRGETPRASLAGAMRSARTQYGDPFLWGAFELSIATSLH